MTTFLSKANNAAGELLSSIGSGDTSLTLKTGEGALFPSSNFLISIDSEIIKVGSRSGDVFSSLVRAQESTAAAAHTANSAVEQRITKGTFTELEDAINQNETDISTHTHPGSGAWTKIFDITLGAAATSIGASGLDLEGDGYYRILLSVRAVSALPETLKWEANGNSTVGDYRRGYIQWDGSSLTTSNINNNSTMKIINSGNTIQTLTFDIWKTASQRLSGIMHCSTGSVGTKEILINSIGFIPTANVTTIDFVAATANNLDIGTRLIILKLS